MIILAGADLVLPDRVLSRSRLVLERDRIVAIEPQDVVAPANATVVDVSGCTIVPGFIDVHVHGVEGHDVLDGVEAVNAVATRLPRYGVTSFCPTSIACDPSVLRMMLQAVNAARSQADACGAHVLPAHLESNFINPEYKGAQPAKCLRRGPGLPSEAPAAAFTGQQIVDVIAAQRADVGIVTLAPEIDGGLDLVRSLTAAGHIVSIGHTGATYEQAQAGIDAGVRHATHLFNRMTPMTHRAPGVPGAVLASEHVVAELICDGFHVHPALMQIAIRVKGVDRIVAITDGTAGSGLPVGTVTHLGDQKITVTDRTALLDDGTLAGSVLTMDGAFRTLVHKLGLSLVEAAQMCATTPARQMGLTATGRLEAGATADLAILDPELRVVQTYVRGARWGNPPTGRLV
jgi:N-acetylglucosamine-6-phosphate deacetylase